MQGFTLAAITAAGQQITCIMCSLRECQGQLLCKVSHQQLTLLQRYFNSRLYIKFGQSQCSVKCRSRALGHGACLKSMLRTISTQGFTTVAITAAEKHTLILDLMQNFDKVSGP